MKLTIVVPCFNEEAVLGVTAARLDAVLERLQAAGKTGADTGICFVDDGSRDQTWALIERLAVQYPRVRGIRLSRNRGHQNALLAGVFHATGDAVVTIDADLQDDETVIETMVDRCAEGYDMVFGVRSDRSVDTPFKRLSAAGYYRLLALMGVEVIDNHADFRLMTRDVVESLRQYDEVNLYLRGIIPLLGFRTTSVAYRRSERFAGVSKYPLSKMIALSLHGITSFSILPLRAIAALGLTISALSLGMAGWALAVKVFGSGALPGWASTVVPLYFLGGLQLLSLGVIGEYLGKIYMETKRRPRYAIQQVTPESTTRSATNAAVTHAPPAHAASSEAAAGRHDRRSTTISG